MMTIEPLTCDKCGARLRIETDDPKYLEKKKEEFSEKHKDCKDAEQNTHNSSR